jgi:hypothetical protein
MADRQRQAGSGLATDTATAIEAMLAACLRGDSDEVGRQERVLRLERQAGRCGIAPYRLRSLVEDVARNLDLDVASARRALPGNPGDVEAVLSDGSSVWFEVKAQTKKASYSDLTQADWVRDATDTLRWLLIKDKDFARTLPRDVRQPLRIDDPDSYFGEWSFRDMWLADVGLITNQRDRFNIGIAAPTDLLGFLHRKYFFHVTQQGARAILLSQLPPVSAALSGTSVEYSLKDNKTSLVSVPVRVGTELGAHFSYHLYVPEVRGRVKGRHKLHARSLDGATFISA